MCYINFRNQIGTLVPIPSHHNAFIAKDDIVDATPPPPLPNAAEGPPIPSYHWPALDGRYLYYARGREYVTRHMDEMGGKEWKGIEAMVERCANCEKEREEKMVAAGGRRQQAMVRRALGVDEEETCVVPALSVGYGELIAYWGLQIREADTAQSSLLALASTTASPCRSDLQPRLQQPRSPARDL